MTIRLERRIPWHHKSRTTEGLAKHDQRARFLDTLAVLIGCTGSLGGQLPDGLRPDVLRYDPTRGILFIGDAKNTESPGCLETQARLMGYLRWLYAHTCTENRPGVFAICFVRETDAKEWMETISLLGREATICFTDQGVERFAPGFIVAWFISGSVPLCDK